MAILKFKSQKGGKSVGMDFSTGPEPFRLTRLRQAIYLRRERGAGFHNPIDACCHPYNLTISFNLHTSVTLLPPGERINSICLPRR